MIYLNVNSRFVGQLSISAYIDSLCFHILQIQQSWLCNGLKEDVAKPSGGPDLLFQLSVARAARVSEALIPHIASEIDDSVKI